MSFARPQHLVETDWLASHLEDPGIRVSAPPKSKSRKIPVADRLAALRDIRRRH